jgi:hypothetical protein
MIEDSFIQKYTQSEKIKKGIEVILKSDNYTDEYKALILKYLGENYNAPTEINTTAEQQLELMDKGGLVIEEGKTGLVKITDKKPASRGRLETPKYIESELVKAIDIVVDELISPPPKQSPPTVPLQTYRDLEAAYSASVIETEDYKDKYFTTLSDLDLANQTIEVLNQDLDFCKLQQAVAENQADVINSRYIALLGDFQSAIQKAIQEAIERVSLTAQVRGLQAQKESLKLIMEQLKFQLENEQQRQAAAEVLDGIPGTFDQKANSGWKLPQSEIVRNGDVLFIRTRNSDEIKELQGTAINIYNFATEEQTYTIEIQGEAKNWLESASTIIIPPRVESIAGRGYINLRYRPLGSTSSRNKTLLGYVQITSSKGDIMTIEAKYEKEVRRSDKWSPRGTTTTVIGSEKD